MFKLGCLLIVTLLILTILKWSTVNISYIINAVLIHHGQVLARWIDETVVTKIRQWVDQGGGFIGVVDQLLPISTR